MQESEKKFKSISVSEQDYNRYEKIRVELSRKMGAKLSMAQVLNIGMTFYDQRRKFVDNSVVKTDEQVRGA